MDLTCEERPSSSLFIERVWRGHSGEGGEFFSIAQPLWGMVVTKYRGRVMLTVRGPETKVTPAYSPADAEFFGIFFKPGTLMPEFPARMLMDRCDVTLPEASSKRFWLKGAAWQFPDYENVETFVDRLAHHDLLIYDPLVSDVLHGQPAEKSLRTAQRRFLQATGLTHGTLYQIDRARQAVILLKEGVSILDTVMQMGYADQPHLTRSLKSFIGQTPTQIINKNRTERLSFLFKTALHSLK